MPSHKSRIRSKETALNGHGASDPIHTTAATSRTGGRGTRPTATGGTSSPTSFRFSLPALFSAVALLLAVAVRLAAYSPSFLFSIGPFEETGHYEGSTVYDRVYRGVFPSLKCTWARNLCLAYVRVESCPVRPKEFRHSAQSIADQVRYMDKHGPNAFHLRVVGGWDIQALSVVDFVVSRVADDDACLYTSRLIDLRTPGEVTFELWHMYANFTGWKILNPGSLFNPSETIQYPERTFTGFGEQQVMTDNYGSFRVPKAFSLGLRSSFLSYKYHGQHHKNPRVISDSGRPSSASRKALCSLDNIHPGTWMTNPDHSSSSACFERMKRFGLPTDDIFDDCIQSMRFVPRSCAIARYSNDQMRRLLYHGGMGPVVREAHSSSKARRFILIGDSHFRTLGNGLIYRLTDLQSKIQAQFHLPVVHEFPTMSPLISGEVEVHYCMMTNPASQTIEECLSSLQIRVDDIIIVGSAAWPLSTHEHGRVQDPQEYRAGVLGVRDVILRGLAMFPALKVYWMSSIAQPMVDSYYLRSIWDHRNDGLNSLLNDISRGILTGTPVKIFDVFNMTLPLNNAPVDNAHYGVFVMKEMVDALLTDLVS